MESFVAFLLTVWSVVCLILFFKVWRMTNDVRAIREKLSPLPKKEHDKYANIPTSWEEVDKNDENTAVNESTL